MTRTEALAEFFRQHPNTWRPSRELAAVAGFCGWRSRISDVRKFGMDISCRVRRVTGSDGQAYKVSEYRYNEPPTMKQPGEAVSSPPPAVWTLQP